MRFAGKMDVFRAVVLPELRRAAMLGLSPSEHALRIQARIDRALKKRYRESQPDNVTRKPDSVAGRVYLHDALNNGNKSTTDQNP